MNASQFSFNALFIIKHKRNFFRHETDYFSKCGAEISHGSADTFAIIITEILEEKLILQSKSICFEAYIIIIYHSIYNNIIIIYHSI